MTESERNAPDNLMLLCRREHKIIDDNEAAYTVERLQRVRRDYLSWLNSQLAPVTPWRISVHAFVYLNVPRLSEYAALQGFQVQNAGPPSGQSLHEMGYELNHVMSAFRRTLESVEIQAVPANEITFASEAYVGQLVFLDSLRFRTRNIPLQRPTGDAPWSFTGDLGADPHVYARLRSTTLVLNIDPRWITTSTAYSTFRPTAGHSLLSGFARITHADLENNQLIATALALGLPAPRLVTARPNQSEIDGRLAQLEDSASTARGDYWHGDVTNCDFCGRSLIDQTYMVDGPVRTNGAWGCACASCFAEGEQPIGPARGQLYRKEHEAWRLVGGWPYALSAD